jgi:hypothetical protein
MGRVTHEALHEMTQQVLDEQEQHSVPPAAACAGEARQALKDAGCPVDRITGS